ncbi:MAG: glycosyltransferase family 4 protein [Erysipelotrichaceae bacterium]|nr:glycosyltransferase family 4 protein [Erysipelotrichaceae bacterium]
MKINFVSNLVSEDLFKKLYTLPNKPGQQVQKFNRLIVKGFIENNVNIKCFSNPPVSKQIIKNTYLKLPNNNIFNYNNIINIPIIKDLACLVSSYYKIKKEIKNNPNSIYICDVLSVPNSLGASIACKKYNKICIGIITDLPELITKNKLYIYLCNKVIENCSSYVLLAETMNKKINKTNKPYIVIEGFADNNTINYQYNGKRDKSIIYAGSLDYVNGIKEFAEAFSELNSDLTLNIYGVGEYQNELIEFSKNINNINFHGVILNSELLPLLRKATFLINPRNINNEITKYSFPSKNMEYLSSGTPFISTKFKSIPKEYDNYINYFNSDTKEGIKNTLINLFNCDYNILLDKASKGQKFVLTEKNNIKQTKKIIDFIDKL